MPLLVRLPTSQRRALVRVVARLARRFDRRHSDQARALLDQAFGDLDELTRERAVLDAWRYLLGLAIDSERIHLDVDLERPLERFELELHADVPKVAQAHHGAVLVGPHVGNWEAAALALTRLGFDRLWAVMRAPRNPYFARHIERTRERLGFRILMRHGALRGALAALRNGDAVALVADQRARIAPVIAPFFGRPAQTEQGYVALMRRAKVPILVAACYATPQPGRYLLAVPEVIWPEECEGQSVEEICTRVNRVMEGLILRHPEQYLWLHDRYRGAKRKRP